MCLADRNDKDILPLCPPPCKPKAILQPRDILTVAAANTQGDVMDIERHAFGIQRLWILGLGAQFLRDLTARYGKTRTNQKPARQKITKITLTRLSSDHRHFTAAGSRQRGSEDERSVSAPLHFLLPVRQRPCFRCVRVRICSGHRQNNRRLFSATLRSCPIVCN